MPAIWQILIHLLSQRGRGSTVIRLTAAVALRQGVDVIILPLLVIYDGLFIVVLQTLDFNPDEFAPFLSGAVTQLMNLIGEANTFDSKRKVDDALNVVIDRAGAKVCVSVAIELTMQCELFFLQIIPLVPLISGPIPALCTCCFFSCRLFRI